MSGVRQFGGCREQSSSSNPAINQRNGVALGGSSRPRAASARRHGGGTRAGAVAGGRSGKPMRVAAREMGCGAVGGQTPRLR